MNISIIGWYGTETIGDRAILAGLLRIFAETYSSFTIQLGSLYPFYSQRTVCEDLAFYRKSARNSDLQISIFDTMNPCELKKNIKKSDLLLVGGGPLMDLSEMDMLLYAFRYAKAHSVKSVLLGCGWGPLKKLHTIKIAIQLVELSSLTIFRDEKSLEECSKYVDISKKNVHALIDPAFFACQVFLDNVNKEPSHEHVAINFRDVTIEGDNYSNKLIPEDIFSKIIVDVASQTKLPIYLVPMHNFYIGGDDRDILRRVERSVRLENVTVMQKPMGLFETMECYYNAAYCVGMRFHSVVLQTVLNGKNFIVDYTDPKNGKIVGMMHALKMFKHYTEQYLSIHENKELKTFKLSNCEQYTLSPTFIQEKQAQYIKLLKEV